MIRSLFWDLRRIASDFDGAEFRFLNLIRKNYEIINLLASLQVIMLDFRGLSEYY